MSRATTSLPRLALGAALLAGAALPARAQDRLVGVRTAELGPVLEAWSFGSGIPQAFGGGALIVGGASELTLPMAVVVPLGADWTVDLYGAWARGRVTIDGSTGDVNRDGVIDESDQVGRRTLRVDGPTDVTVRVTGRLRGDALLVTAGVNLPTGSTSLDGEALGALRVIGAPALRFQTSSFGSGLGATTGIVLTREVAGWAVALGTSYEYRGTYAPTRAFASGYGEPDLDPGDAVHLSLGADGFVAGSRVSVALSTDLFTTDELRVPGETGTTVLEYRSDPLYTAELYWQGSGGRWREAMAYVVDRYRSGFRNAQGQAVRGSRGNELEAGLGGVLGLAPRLGLALSLEGRHHTGLKTDETIATAAYAGGGATVGLAWQAGGVALQPFVRAQAGRMDTGGVTRTIRAASAGITLGTSF